jgi:hypothetical protein
VFSGIHFQTRWWVAVAQARRSVLALAGVSGSKLTSWNTAVGGGTGPFTPAIRSTIERPRKLFCWGARARFTSVGAMSTWPTGSVTRRAGNPGTRTISGTLVWGAYRS